MNRGTHEFRVHHEVRELMSVLKISSRDGPGAEVYTDMLQKNMTPYITTQVSAHNAKRKIAESTSTPKEFLQKYDELKSKNTRDLDSLVYLLSKMSDSEQVKEFLHENAEMQAANVGATLNMPSALAPQLPLSNTEITPEEVYKLRAKLLKESRKTPAAVPTEPLRKMLRNKLSSKTRLPVQPEWIYSRPYLSADFVDDTSEPADADMVPIGSLPVKQQEMAIIHDLLYCMEGTEGKYIQALPLTDKTQQRDFRVDQSIDPCIRELVKRVLPLCSNYSIVVRFIEERMAFEYGLVSHALSAAMRKLIRDYTLLVAQLEEQVIKGQLSLQKLYFYLQPTMRNMEILASVANAIIRGHCVGGAILSLLHDRTSSHIGDAKGQELCLYLTQAACVPYFEILEKWIYKGIIIDPYSEFLVEENTDCQKENLQEDYTDDYWEQHYTICRERIPQFMERVADKILNTGKYLNVVRQCGRDVKCPLAEEIVYTLQEREYFENIESAYNYASKLLLDLLMEEKELMARLRSIKHYFLLDQGDFISLFLDMAEDEMKKKMDEIMPTRLDTLLELALRTSTANVDPFKDDLKVDLLPYDLTTQLFKILSIETKAEKEFKMDTTDLHLTGLEAFTFDYLVKWPVSLVLNRKALTRYQMLFRHLFYSKHVERQLCNVWSSNKSAKQYTLHSTRWYTSAFALRQRMLNFVQNFEYYMMFEVIEPSWHVFENNMNSVSNIDDVLAYHTDFLNNCLKDCMLTNPQLLKIVHKLMMVCVTFSNFVQRTNIELLASKMTKGAPVGIQTSKQRKDETQKKETTKKVLLEHVDQLAGSENFEKAINKFDSNFSGLLVDLLDNIIEFTSSEHKLMNILYRLDFNNFYTARLEARSAQRSMRDSSREHSHISSGSTSSSHASSLRSSPSRRTKSPGRGAIPKSSTVS